MASYFDSIASAIAFWPAVILFIGVGVVGLKYGADYLVEGAANIGFRLGISATMIGLTIVAFGTSAPELVVSVLTAVDNKPEICLGNVIGSNIANTTLILGAAAMILPLSISKSTVRQDAPLSLAAITMVFILSFIGMGLSRLDGIILLLTFSIWMGWLIRKSLYMAKSSRQRRDQDSSSEEPHFHKRSIGMDLFYILLGLIGLVIGADALVTGAVESAIALSVPEVVVGLTVVAGGTSLPELAVSVMAALKKHDDISVGNVMGSNIFNALLILGVAVCIAPISFAESGSGNQQTLFIDIPICVASAVLIMALIYNRKLGRGKGVLLTATYLGYIAFLVVRSI